MCLVKWCVGKMAYEVRCPCKNIAVVVENCAVLLYNCLSLFPCSCARLSVAAVDFLSIEFKFMNRDEAAPDHVRTDKWVWKEKKR